MPEAFDTPIRMPVTRVLPDWIDYNGHMNMAFYLLAFDQAGVDPFLKMLGVGEQYTARGLGSCFTLNCSVSYLRELNEGDEFEIGCQLLDHDVKLLHLFMTMRQVHGDFIAATAELLSIHVDLETRKPAPFPAETLALLERMLAGHRRLPRHRLVGQTPGIRRRPG